MDLASGAPRCVTCNLRCPRGPGGGKASGGKGATKGATRRRAGLAAMGAASATTGSIGARVRELVSMDAAAELVQGGPICGANNRTYLSWCHMRKDACATGYVIDTRHSGACGAPTPPRLPPGVSAEDDEDDAKEHKGGKCAVHSVSVNCKEQAN